MDGDDLEQLRGEIEAEVGALHAKAAEVLELAERLEKLTEKTDAWYAGTRARVEARATVEQAEELRQVLEDLGERSAT